MDFFEILSFSSEATCAYNKIVDVGCPMHEKRLDGP
jgi:hypothetical protein